MAILIILAGKATDVEFELGPCTGIGRGDENEIRIFDETSSRLHASIEKDAEVFILRDLNSSNGTYVNGERVAQARLQEGDEIAIGEILFRFLLGKTGAQETVIIAPNDSIRIHSAIEADGYSAATCGEAGTEDSILRKALEIQALVSGTLDPDEIMDRVNDALFRFIGGDRAALLSASASGTVEPLAVRRSRKEGRKPFILSRAVVEEVVREKRSLLVTDANLDPVLGARESILQQDVSTAICVPLVESGRVTTLIYLDRTGDSEPFTESDLRTAAAVAEQAAPAIQNARTFSRLTHHARNLEKVAGGELHIIGSSTLFIEALDMARRVAGTDSTVLIYGETGTGKELVARLIHLKSKRRQKPFVPVNCAALVGSLLESELFGHEKGAFTGAARRKPGRFELADGGTLFLDEIGEMPLEVQVKLLRAIQEKKFFRVGGTVPVEVNIRIVAATNRNLVKRIETSEFRSDLYYRLSVVTVEVPPLRSRRDDILELARHFLQKNAVKVGRAVEGFSPEAEEKLLAYAWPGNVRELENIVERAVILSTEPVLGPDLVPVSHGGGPGDDAGEVITLKEAERRAVVAALRHTKGKKGEAARLLGTSWPTLNKKILDYGIEV
jgi:transcriptional regulator with GAF, ATPase, and Fis domain